MLPARPIRISSASALGAAGCAALGMACVGAAAIYELNWPVRLVISCIGALLLAGAAAIAWKRPNLDTLLVAFVQEQLNASGSDLADAWSDEKLSALGMDPRLTQTLAALRERLLAASARVEEAELTRAGAEVRGRRATVERDQFREILTNIGDPVLAIGAYGELIHASASAARLFQLDDVATGAPCIEKLTAFNEVAVLLNDARRRRTGSQRTAELNIVDAAGKTHTLRAACRPLMQTTSDRATEDAAGQGAMAVFTDISAHKAIQKRHAEFVSAASHELKTPLSSIRAYVELLADGEAEDEQTREEFFNVIHTQVERLQRLIENLLNLARIEAGVVDVKKLPRAVNELLQEAAETVQPAADAKQIELTIDFSPLYLGVLADRDTLLQAAINLLSNAVKYTPAGGAVTLRSRLRDEDVVCEVVDNGVGLSEQDCQLVFDKFFRVKKDQQMAPGTGLGLSLVKHIVEDIHGGRVELESKLGEGSVFRIVLPSLSQLKA